MKTGRLFPAFLLARSAAAEGSAHFSTVLQAPRRGPDWPRIGLAAGAGLAAGLVILALAVRARRKRATTDLAVMAHELKTPLSAIESYLDLMVREGAAADTTQARQWLDDARRLKSTAAELRQTVTDLLEAAQLEAGRVALSRKAIDLKALAEECLKLHAPRSRAAGVELSLEAAAALAPADADEARLRQVFHNLLSNALKHTPAGGRVRVVLKPGADGPGALECTIGDTGPGIPAPDQQRLFRKFSRLGTGDGAGLGLYIARTIVEAHGGRIWVDSAAGRGSEFSFSVPTAHG